MGLVKAKEPVPLNYTDPIAAKINQRRRQMLVHSYIYYELDTNVVSDHDWARWANELVQLQKDYPEIAAKLPYAKEFSTFDGSTGFYLVKACSESIVSVAHFLVRINEEDRKKEEKVENEKTSRCTLHKGLFKPSGAPNS